MGQNFHQCKQVVKLMENFSWWKFPAVQYLSMHVIYTVGTCRGLHPQSSQPPECDRVCGRGSPPPLLHPGVGLRRQPQVNHWKVPQSRCEDQPHGTAEHCLPGTWKLYGTMYITVYRESNQSISVSVDVFSLWSFVSSFCVCSGLSCMIHMRPLTFFF